MVKENKDFFLYVLGIIVLFFLTIVFLDFLVPGFVSDDQCGLLGLKCFFNDMTKGDKVYSSYPEMIIEEGKDYKAVIETNLGSFEVDLYEKNAPLAVNNFIFLVNDDYYDGVKFHRVVKDLLIQTGDRNTLDDDNENDGEGGPGYTYEDEINWESLNLSNAKIQQLQNLGFSSNEEVESKHLEKKSIALANKGPSSNGSQFFIITASSNDTSVKGLEGRHTVFGIVISGWEVIESIENCEVDDQELNSPRPVEDIFIVDIQIQES